MDIKEDAINKFVNICAKLWKLDIIKNEEYEKLIKFICEKDGIR